VQIKTGNILQVVRKEIADINSYGVSYPIDAKLIQKNLN
jgi:hypothetical protein